MRIKIQLILLVMAILGFTFSPIHAEQITYQTNVKIEGDLVVTNGTAEANANFHVYGNMAVVGSNITIHAENGIDFTGGPVTGDGSGLTNLNVNSLNGPISVSQLPTSGNWDAGGLSISNLTLAKMFYTKDEVNAAIDAAVYEALNKFGDRDSDELPDWWESLYFDNPISANPASDPDGDGISNLKEYERASDPTDPTSVLTLYVSQDGKHIPPFITWENAATNIQDAIDMAVDGESVLVTNGIYATGSRMSPHNLSPLMNRVVITNDITLQSMNGAEHTLIVGATSTNGACGLDAVRCVYMSAGTISGLTLTNGHTHSEQGQDVNNNQTGGGVHAILGGVIRDCIITGNRARLGGGSYGGVIDRCEIIGNRADHEGGGTYDGFLNNCAINNNSAVSAGGGTYAGMFNHCTISGNRSEYGSGGTYGGIFSNCIVYHNTALIHSDNYYESIFSYSCTTPYSGGEGNITEKPRLLTTKHIATNSPCVGAGNAADATETDMDGDLWLNPPSMGCNEMYPQKLVGNLTVAISASATQAVVKYNVSFTADVQGQSCDNIWSLDGGTKMTNTAYVNHSWETSGDYTIILTAYNHDNPSGISATQTVSIVEQPTYYVDKSNPNPSWPYTTWATAANNIQDAIDEAKLSGSLVLVTNGIYNVGEIVTPNYNLKNRIVIANDITVQSVNGPEMTIIEGQGPIGSNAVRCAYVAKGVLSGFTLTNGYTLDTGDPLHDQSGGGINAWFWGSITNCTIIGNHAEDFGGGILLSGTINHCTIRDNDASRGGGTSGGTINYCEISGNSASDGGGGCQNSILNNCTIVENSSTADYGGGAHDCIINNSIVYYNTSLGSPNYDSNSTLSYSCTTPLPIPANVGNIAKEPSFSDMVIGDYHLLLGSPCIDAGSNDHTSGTTDLDGNPRIMNDVVDMGAYEYQN